MEIDEQILHINYYYHNKADIERILEYYAMINHTHDQYLTNVDLDGKVDVAQGSNKALKNVVTDANGNITTENKPTIPTKVSDLNNDLHFINSVDWTDISNKPNDFQPTAHTHTKADITDFPTIPTNTAQIKDTNAYSNIGSVANATQANINSLINNKIGAKINISDIQDNLSSDATNKPLSAKQGKVLQTAINNLSGICDDILLNMQDKENVSNKVSSWSNILSDTKYPSEKLVKQSLNTKADKTDLNLYVKKEDVDLKFDLETNGYVTIGLNVGDGF